MIEKMFDSNIIYCCINLKNMVFNPSLNERDDLMSDFVSIITSFCSRLYGLRRSRTKYRKTHKGTKQ